MAKKLTCIGRYINGPKNLAFNPGEKIEVDDVLYQFLMVDAPGCFETTKAIQKPARNKAIRTPKVNK